jgi:N-acetylglucosamine malate deacetylase 2
MRIARLCSSKPSRERGSETRGRAIRLVPLKRYLYYVVLIIAILQDVTTDTQEVRHSNAQDGSRAHVLVIVAHPDDEYEMAATIYRITKELSGKVDQVIITDGEAGYRYSYLAARYYGIDLTDESIGRAKLPRIREEEARGAARILGIEHQWFLNEHDDHYTLDAEEVLNKGWRTQHVLDFLVQRLAKGNYNVVFVVLPAGDTHGQHKAASILALRAVEQLPANRRPAILGAQASPKNTDAYQSLPAYPITATTSSVPQFDFDRDTHFGFKNSLSYQIVVDWVIAEHKSVIRIVLRTSGYSL